MYQIYTIGHSNHAQEEFVDLLIKAQVEILVDVRSNPNSRWAPFANKENLKKILKLSKIYYLYLGDVLGGHPSDPMGDNQKKRQVNYRAIQEKETFKNGTKRILEGLKNYRLCLMCAEEDPANCHRNLLVAESLRQEGVKILHIRGDGCIQTDEELWKEKLGIADNQYTLPI